MAGGREPSRQKARQVKAEAEGLKEQKRVAGELGGGQGGWGRDVAGMAA